MHNFNGNYEEKSLKNLVSQLDMIDEGCNDLDQNSGPEINLLNENLNISLNSNKTIENDEKCHSALDKGFIEENESNLEFEDKHMFQHSNNIENIENINDFNNEALLNNEKESEEVKCPNSEIDKLIRKEKEILITEKHNNIYTKKEEKVILENLRKIKIFIRTSEHSKSKKKNKRTKNL